MGKKHHSCPYYVLMDICKYCKVELVKTKVTGLYLDKDRNPYCKDIHYPSFHYPINFNNYLDALPDRKGKIGI